RQIGGVAQRRRDDRQRPGGRSGFHLGDSVIGTPPTESARPVARQRLLSATTGRTFAVMSLRAGVSSCARRLPDVPVIESADYNSSCSTTNTPVSLCIHGSHRWSIL